jgi:hypothetical protein
MGERSDFHNMYWNNIFREQFQKAKVKNRLRIFIFCYFSLFYCFPATIVFPRLSFSLLLPSEIMDGGFTTVCLQVYFRQSLNHGFHRQIPLNWNKTSVNCYLLFQVWAHHMQKLLRTLSCFKKMEHFQMSQPWTLAQMEAADLILTNEVSSKSWVFKTTFIYMFCFCELKSLST